MQNLRKLIRTRRDGFVAPGVYDAFTALLAEEAGFDCLYLSGASIAYTRLGRPDIGLTSVSEVVDTVALIRDRVSLPLIVDGDTGYGNALNTQRTVRQFERAGASAIQLEDQGFPKKCGHLAGKNLISTDEMTGKIAASCDARCNEDFLVIARTDAIAVEGFDAAIARAERYLTAGADILFVEAPRNRQELEAIGTRFGTRTPLIANMVEGGRTPITSAQDLHKIGFQIVIFPGGLARAVLWQARNYFASLRRNGSNTAFQDRMVDFDELNRTVGLPEMVTLSTRWSDKIKI